MAVPPAVILGLLVIEVNRDALLQEVQQVNLTVANRLGDAVARKLDGHVVVLDHAERVLDLDPPVAEVQRGLLQAIVADARVPYLAIYDAARNIDSTVRRETTNKSQVLPLSREEAAEARERGFTVGAPHFTEDGVRVGVFVPWLRADEFLGYVGTRFDVGSLESTAESLVTHHLGADGELEIVDGLGRYLISTKRRPIGETAHAASPFGGLVGGQLRSGMVAVHTGRSMAFEAPDGKERLGSIVSVPELKWIIGSSRDKGLALASIQTVKRRTIALAFVAALAAGLVGLLAARRITEPLARLARSVRRSAKEGFSSRVTVEGSKEVSALGVTFNSVMEELEIHKRALSRKTQMQVRLARFLTPTALRELLTQELRAKATLPPEPVTVLYADLGTATEVTKDSDRELMVQILAEFYENACQAVENAGGVVDEYSGDAVVGVFRGGVQLGVKNGLQAAREILRRAHALREDNPGKADFIGQAVVGLASDETQVLEDTGTYAGISVSGDLVERAAALMSEGKPGRIVLDERSFSPLKLTPGVGLPTTTGQYELDPDTLPPEVGP